ncbi:uncharacterized protein M6B38_228790 [Iris pallida]|uniref:Uncharacterized protein n=1 Tax=Iris pallida TaxID=29817 RepID=A0AAX6DT57_IRIPA|nr:uncharacterized protein M6B38_228790 [Iris pallida]
MWWGGGKDVLNNQNNMAPSVTVQASSSPKGAATKKEVPLASPKGGAAARGGGGGGGLQCLCSPTTHQGSFRCRFHRSGASSTRMLRSKSMPPSMKSATIPLPAKPLETA